MIPENVKMRHDWYIRVARNARWAGDRRMAAYWLQTATGVRRAYVKTQHYRATGELIEWRGSPLGFIPASQTPKRERSRA